MKKFFDFKNVFFVVCLSALLVACSKQEQIERDRPVVQVARVIALTGDVTRSYTFISEPIRVTQLAFRVGGPVQDFTVQAGQFFRKGQLIAAVDERDFLIRRDRAEALYRQALSQDREPCRPLQDNRLRQEGNPCRRHAAAVGQASAQGGRRARPPSGRRRHVGGQRWLRRRARRVLWPE